MTTTGSLNRAADYNNIQLMLHRLLNDNINDYPSDPAAGTYGYGQNVLSNQVVRVVDLPSASQMASLKTDILKIATHLGLQSNPVITTLPNIQKGDLILADHLTKFENCLNYLTANRFLLGPGQYSDESLFANVRTIPWGNNSRYKGIYGGELVTHQFTLDFGSAANARYFFNSGGSIRLTASRTGGSTTPQNTSWSTLLSSLGNVVFTYNQTLAGISGGTQIGFYQLTNTPQTVFTSAGSSPYAANHYYVTVSSDFGDNSRGGARYLYFSVYFDDAHFTHMAHAYHNDWVDGTLTSTTSIRRATGANVEVVAPIGIQTVNLMTNQ